MKSVPDIATARKKLSDYPKRALNQELLQYFVDFDSFTKKEGVDKIFTSEELYQHFVLKIDVLTVDELEKMNIKTLAKAVGGIQELARKEAKHVIWKDNPIPAYYRLPQQEEAKEEKKDIKIEEKKETS